MNAKEFYEKVKEMRKRQRAYFNCRTQANLKAAKDIERVIDDEIDRVEEILHPTPKQLDLFNNN